MKLKTLNINISSVKCSKSFSF